MRRVQERVSAAAALAPAVFPARRRCRGSSSGCEATANQGTHHPSTAAPTAAFIVEPHVSWRGRTLSSRAPPLAGAPSGRSQVIPMVGRGSGPRPQARRLGLANGHSSRLFSDSFAIRCPQSEARAVFSALIPCRGISGVARRSQGISRPWGRWSLFAGPMWVKTPGEEGGFGHTHTGTYAVAYASIGASRSPTPHPRHPTHSSPPTPRPPYPGYIAGLLAVDNAPRVLDALGAGGARWLLFWAAVGAVVFVYLHTDIRHTLGSARQGRLNYRTLYTVWLVAAVLYHVPTLSALGIDIRSDVSLLLTVFIVTFALSGAVEGLRQLLVAVGAYPASYQVLPKGASWKSVATVLVVNSAIAAFACSSFYSFCGEHAALHGPASWASGSTLVGKFALGLRSASKSVICDTMVHRVGVPEEYPAFSGLLLYSDPSPGGG